VKPWLDAVAQDTVCVTHGGVIRAIFALTGTLARSEAAILPVPQDRVLRLAGGTLEWI
jgi:probable phosphoglycerate mutase